MPVNKNNAQPPRLNVKAQAAKAPAPKSVAADPKATAPQNQLINRQLVASAFDRPGNDGSAPDGVISKEELAAAGISRLDQDAVDAINAYGERGDAITVNELAQALQADKVTITGDGNVTISNGQASVRNGRLQSSTPWNFPYVQGLRTLEQVKQIAPSGWSGYNPDSPSSEFTYNARVKDRYGNYLKYETGMSLNTGEYVGDSNGNQIAQGDTTTQAYVWKTYTDYDRLESVLEEKARSIYDITGNAKDPEIQQIHNQVNRLIYQGYWSSSNSRDRARDLFNALSQFDDIQVPTNPEDRLTRLSGSIDNAKKSVDDQFRIVRDIPVERARDAVSAKVTQLKAPSASNFISGILGGAALGVGGFFALGSALAGGALIGAAAGLGVVGLAAGWFIAQAIKNSKASGLQNDLKVLQSIRPDANRQQLNQYAFGGYKMMEDSRSADTLARLRAFDEDAQKESATIDGFTGQVSDQTQSLKNMESLVNSYAK